MTQEYFSTKIDQIPQRWAILADCRCRRKTSPKRFRLGIYQHMPVYKTGTITVGGVECVDKLSTLYQSKSLKLLQ